VEEKKQSFFVNKFLLIRWATILAFDVKIEKDAQEHANSIGRLTFYFLM
jgi:hypothetical protein